MYMLRTNEIVLYTMTKFTLKVKPRKSRWGISQRYMSPYFVTQVTSVITGFGDFPVSSWKTNLHTILELFHYQFLRKRIVLISYSRAGVIWTTYGKKKGKGRGGSGGGGGGKRERLQ